jgi:hypothetical protein
MFLDTNLLFFHSGTTYAFTSGEFFSLAGVTAGTASAVINLGTARDLGIGDGEAVPKLACTIGTAITSSSTGLRLNFQFQGSTDSTNWTTYVESGALATSAFLVNTNVFPIDVPQRPAGASLPTYYRLNIAQTGTTVESISSGTILAGIVVQRDQENAGAHYGSGFSVV